VLSPIQLSHTSWDAIITHGVGIQRKGLNERKEHEGNEKFQLAGEKKRHAETAIGDGEGRKKVRSARDIGVPFKTSKRPYFISEAIRRGAKPQNSGESREWEWNVKATLFSLEGLW